MATAIEQLEAMRRLGENWDGYGGASPRPEAIVLAQAFVGFIEAAMRGGRSPREATLHASPTRIGGVLIEWDDGLVEHEADFAPDGSIGFLHLNKQTKQIETRKFSPGAPAVVSPGLLAELQHLLAA